MKQLHSLHTLASDVDDGQEWGLALSPATDLFSCLLVVYRAVSFFSSSSSTGISFPYPHITLHAISQTTSLPSSSSTNGATTNGNGATETEEAGPCLYCQLEEADEITEDDMGEGMREMWIVPKGEGKRTKENRKFIVSSLRRIVSLIVEHSVQSINSSNQSPTAPPSILLLHP